MAKNWEGSKAECLALGDTGVIVVQRDGTCWFSSGIPRQLGNWIKGRQKHLPPVDLVAIGPSSVCFVQFCDGKSKCCGPDLLSEALRRRESSRVELLAFASDEGWYVLWEDGCSEWYNLPRGLHNVLNGRQKSLPPVEELSIGPNDEWFVRFLDGKWKTGNLSEEVSVTLETCRRRWDIMSISFGQDPYIGGYAIRYNEHYT